MQATIFLISPLLAHAVADQDVRVIDYYSVVEVLFVLMSRKEGFSYQIFTILRPYHVWRLHEARDCEFYLRYDHVGRIVLKLKVINRRAGDKIIWVYTSWQAVFLFMCSA